MTPQDEERLWRNRFILINLLRIGATIVVLAALLLWQTDYVVEGGSIIGFPIAFAGLVVAFFGPKWLAGRWRSPPAS
jgi:hypothetical protein